MKKPYISLNERNMIYEDTLTGSFIMLRFRWKQFEKSLFNIPFVYIYKLMVKVLEYGR